jgi:anti-sigma factor RsiW
VHGDRSDAVAHWRALQAESEDQPHAPFDGPAGAPSPYPRRRRRRRRRSGAPRLTDGS